MVHRISTLQHHYDSCGLEIDALALPAGGEAASRRGDPFPRRAGKDGQVDGPRKEIAVIHAAGLDVMANGFLASPFAFDGGLGRRPSGDAASHWRAGSG